MAALDLEPLVNQTMDTIELVGVLQFLMENETMEWRDTTIVIISIHITQLG